MSETIIQNSNQALGIGHFCKKSLKLKVQGSRLKVQNSQTLKLAHFYILKSSNRFPFSIFHCPFFSLLGKKKALSQNCNRA